MKIKLLVVGKTTDSLLKSLILNYKKRIKRYVNFEIIELNVPKFKNGKISEIKKKEGIKILEKINIDDQIFLLDEKGDNYNSVEFAKFVENKTISHGKSIVFTGKLLSLSRDEAKQLTLQLGAKILNAISTNTDYLICGEKPGSKVVKAQNLNIKILSENEWLSMIK